MRNWYTSVGRGLRVAGFLGIDITLATYAPSHHAPRLARECWRRILPGFAVWIAAVLFTVDTRMERPKSTVSACINVRVEMTLENVTSLQSRR